jgi:hypothetical protein
MYAAYLVHAQLSTNYTPPMAMPSTAHAQYNIAATAMHLQPARLLHGSGLLQCGRT